MHYHSFLFRAYFRIRKNSSEGYGEGLQRGTRKKRETSKLGDREKISEEGVVLLNLTA